MYNIRYKFVVRRDRPVSPHGGVALFKNYIDASEIALH